MPSTRSEAKPGYEARLGEVELDASFELTPDCITLLGGPGLEGFYATADWYRLVLQAALPTDAQPCFVIARINARPEALLALQRLADGTLQSLTTPYSCAWQPALKIEPSAIGTAVAKFCRTTTSLRLEALDPAWPHLQPFCDGMRRGGFIPLRFDHFGNWHETVEGQNWPTYLAAREGTLRETIRRRTARAGRDPAVRLELLQTAAEIPPGIAAFETVYARSWKRPEPYPNFNAGLIRMAAATGALRLGLMWHADTPIAVQLWIVVDGAASVLKLAHDEDHRALSPGTVLTAWMIRRLLDVEHVRTLDFGRGDDPYKQGWAGQRRQRIGILFANLRRPAGLSLLARHLAGTVRRNCHRTATTLYNIFTN